MYILFMPYHICFGSNCSALTFVDLLATKLKLSRRRQQRQQSRRSTVNMTVPSGTTWLHPPPWLHPVAPPPKKAPPSLKAPPLAWLVQAAPWHSPTTSTASVVVTASSIHEVQSVQSEETHAPSAATDDLQVLRQRVQTLEQIVQHLTLSYAILRANAAPNAAPNTAPTLSECSCHMCMNAAVAAANAASSSHQQWTPPPTHGPPPAAATPTEWTPPPPPHPPPAAAAHGYNLPPPAAAPTSSCSGARPLAFCATRGCDYYANISCCSWNGFCCWCCREASLLRRPWRPHGKWCQKHKQPW